MQPEEGGKKNVDAIALENDVIADEESDSAEGDEGKELQATTKEPRGQGERHARETRRDSWLWVGWRS